MARYARLLLAVMAFTGSWVGFAATDAAGAAPSCDLYASPSGSDSGSGQISSPLATPSALDQALAPGQTGCLQGGSYGNIHSALRLTHSGNAGGQITITSAPGQTVKLIGLVEIEGSDITVSGLDIDGSNDLYTGERSGTRCPYPVSNGLEIDGRHDVFENNNLYQSVASLRGNGIGIGWNSPADHSIVRYNRIHDLGQCQAYDQMIYLAHGSGVQIYDNWMWNDPHGWGIQVYPEAANAHIYNNVIDHAGSGFVVGGSSQVSGNTIDHNIVMDSTGLSYAGLLKGVGISTCDGMGSNNTFTDNDLYDNPGGIEAAGQIGMRGNTTSAPGLIDASRHDYRTTAGSSHSSWNLWNGSVGSLQARARAAVRARDRVVGRRRAAARSAPRHQRHLRRR